MSPPAITSALTATLTVTLDGSNWATFVKKFRIFLLGLNALWVLDAGPGTEADNIVLDRMIVSHLYSHVHDDFQYLVEDLVSATAAYKAPKGHFEKSTMTNRILGHAELIAIRHNATKEVSVYIRAMADAAKKLTAMNVTIDETYHKDLLLINLHPSFSAVRAVLLARATEPTLKEVTDLLTASSGDPGIKQEDDGFSPLAFLARGPPHPPPRTALAAKSSSPLTGTISADGFPQDSQGYRWCDPTSSNCHRCGRTGHIAHKCMHTMPAFVKDWINSNVRAPQRNKPSRKASHLHEAVVNILDDEEISSSQLPKVRLHRMLDHDHNNHQNPRASDIFEAAMPAVAKLLAEFNSNHPLVRHFTRFSKKKPKKIEGKPPGKRISKTDSLTAHSWMYSIGLCPTAEMSAVMERFLERLLRREELRCIPSLERNRRVFGVGSALLQILVIQDELGEQLNLNGDFLDDLRRRRVVSCGREGLKVIHFMMSAVLGSIAGGTSTIEKHAKLEKQLTIWEDGQRPPTYRRLANLPYTSTDPIIIVVKRVAEEVVEGVGEERGKKRAKTLPKPRPRRKNDPPRTLRGLSP
ncbi:hypothetical protein R3P38DRAFT_3493254 [Favolaschia claudopus]|uniref:CCHC-type domain-containing protein n=1 Tax=Favolaschia claudopus TaxID=2862362 RepID=A0AAW0C6U2_9AGAR